MKPILNIMEEVFKSEENQLNEYLNDADGLIYCSKCHTPRQHRVEFWNEYFFLKFVVVVSRMNITKKK